MIIKDFALHAHSLCQRAVARVHAVIQHFQERIHLCAECTYLTAVSWEAHGMYGYAAMILLAVTIIGVFIKTGE